MGPCLRRDERLLWLYLRTTDANRSRHPSVTASAGAPPDPRRDVPLPAGVRAAAVGADTPIASARRRRPVRVEACAQAAGAGAAEAGERAAALLGRPAPPGRGAWAAGGVAAAVSGAAA